MGLPLAFLAYKSYFVTEIEKTPLSYSKKSDHNSIFALKDSTSFKILITRFEDYLNQDETYCIGRSIQENIGTIDVEKSNLPTILPIYADTIAPPINSRIAKEIQQKHNADLIIYGLAKNISNCDSANVCFRYNFDKKLIESESYTLDIPYYNHDAKYILTSPEKIILDDFEINEYSLGKWVSLLAQLKLNKNRISFAGLEKLLIEFDSIPGENTIKNYLNIGKTCESLNLNDCAILAYSKVIDINPFEPKYYNFRGIVYKEIKKYDEALSDYSKAIELNPEYSDAFYNRGVVYSRKKRYDSAIVNFKRAIEINRADEDYYIYLGNVYGKTGEFEQSIKYLDSAIIINPQNAFAYSNRGVSRRNSNNPKSAIQDFEKALSLDSTCSAAYNSRGIYYKNAKQYELSLKDYNNAIRYAKNEHTYAYFNRGFLYFLMKDYDKAIKDFNTSISLDPDDYDGYFYRAEAQYSLKNYKYATEDFRKVTKLNGYTFEPRLYFRKARSYYFLKDYQLALKNFDSLISIDSTEAAVYFYKALTHKKNKERKKAIVDFGKAIELNPNDSNYYNSRGVVKLLLGDINNSIQDFKNAISLKPSFLYAYINLFFAYFLKYWIAITLAIISTIAIIKRKILFSLLRRSSKT